jgi:hypothetical protein
MTADVFSLAVSQVVEGATIEARDLMSIDADICLDEARRRGAETFVEALGIDIREALGLLLCCGVLPDEDKVYQNHSRADPGISGRAQKSGGGLSHSGGARRDGGGQMILDEIALICLLAMAEMVGSYGGNIPPGHDEKVVVCLEVARAAEDLELPVSLVVSVAYEESKFERDLTSKAGARGPLQIIPRYHCPGPEGEHKPHERQGTLEGCDLVRDGVKALGWFWETV